METFKDLGAWLFWIFIIICAIVVLSTTTKAAYTYLTTEYYFVRTNSCGFVVYAKNPRDAAQHVLDQGCKGLNEVKEL